MPERERVLSPIVGELHTRLQTVTDRSRPFITLSYAQSLDGSIASAGRQPLQLSGPGSLQLTHELRAAHDAILVGIGTVLSDNPRLNVRHDVAGTDPRPIVVDSRLRTPDDAHLMADGRGTWIATTEHASSADVERVRSHGAEVLATDGLENGWVDLGSLMTTLSSRGISHVLVEGGARILTSFLEARLVDYVVVTVAPQFVGGVSCLCESELSPFPRLTSWQSERVGDDLILAGELSWPQ